MLWRVTTASINDERQTLDVEADSDGAAILWVQQQGYTVTSVQPITSPQPISAADALAAAVPVRPVGYSQQSEPKSYRRTKATNALGVISLLFGVFTILFSWVPGWGFLTIPIALVGLTFAIVGFIVGLLLGRWEKISPAVGFAFIAVAVSLPFFTTFGLVGGVQHMRLVGEHLVALVTKQSNAAAANANAQSATPLLNVDASTILWSYNNNEVRADHIYKERMLSVTGKVEQVGKDITGDPYVILKPPHEVSTSEIQCSFDRSSSNLLTALSPGDTVTIVGKCNGKIVSVIISNCRLSSVTPK